MDLFNQLIKLGSQDKSLQKHLKPILDKVANEYLDEAKNFIENIKPNVVKEIEKVARNYKGIEGVTTDISYGVRNRPDVYLLCSLDLGDEKVRVCDVKVSYNPEGENQAMVSLYSVHANGDREYLDNTNTAPLSRFRLSGIGNEIEKIIERKWPSKYYGKVRGREYKIIQIENRFNRWLRKRTDSEYPDESSRGRNSLRGSIRDWDINKEFEFQDRQNIKKVVSKHKSDLEKYMMGIDGEDLIESIEVHHADKNYLDVKINLKS